MVMLYKSIGQTVSQVWLPHGEKPLQSPPTMAKPPFFHGNPMKVWLIPQVGELLVLKALISHDFTEIICDYSPLSLQLSSYWSPHECGKLNAINLQSLMVDANPFLVRLRMVHYCLNLYVDGYLPCANHTMFHRFIRFFIRLVYHH